MKIAIHGKPFAKERTAAVCAFFDLLQHSGQITGLFVQKDFYEYIVHNTTIKPRVDTLFTSTDDFPADTDLTFSIGGDGTMLETLTYISRREIPAVGVNIGRLGFLANISIDDMPKALDAIFAANYSFEKRTLIQMDSTPAMFEPFPVALNEVTIHKADSSSMINIHVYLNDTYLNSYWADGLIVSTPTGSTAYSLSVGGPVMLPDNNNFIIAPIAPHNLSVRPLVVSDKVVIRLRVEGRCDKFFATMDSRSQTFDSACEITLRKADFHFNLLKLPEQTFCGMLRNKLMWGADKRN